MIISQSRLILGRLDELSKSLFELFFENKCDVMVRKNCSQICEKVIYSFESNKTFIRIMIEKYNVLERVTAHNNIIKTKNLVKALYPVILNGKLNCSALKQFKY